MSDDVLGRFGYQQELRRGVGLADLVFYGLIFMVPIAPFAIFGTVFAASGGMPVLAYAVGLVALLLTAASYTQMLRAFPLAGSVYSYAGRSIGASAGFLTGWAIFLDYILVPSLLYLIAATAMHAAVPSIPVWLWLIGFVLANTLINLRGIRMTALFTKVMIVGELIVLAVFLGIGIWALADGRGHGWSLTPLFNSETFTWPIILGAVSVAVLSFLGFDGISMLAEEARGGAAQVGKAIKLALILAGVLFIVQVWVASLLVADPAALLAAGDPDGTAFYDAAAQTGVSWLADLTSTATAIAWGLADTLVAQVAVSRLLYAMARDRQLPRFLATVSMKRGVPANATLLVAALSTVVGVWMSTRADGIGLLVGLVNMGAMVAFVVLHLSVIVHYLIRNRSGNLLAHLVLPLAGIGVLVMVIVNAGVWAQALGAVWLILGVVALIGMTLAGRSPTLAGMSRAE